MERHNGIEFDPEGAFVYYDDAQRALDAEREKVKRLSTCGTDHSTPWWQVKCEDLEAQLATLQAQLEALRQERDEARHSRDVFKSQMIAHMNDRDSYAEDLATLQAQLAAVRDERDRWKENAEAHDEDHLIIGSLTDQVQALQVQLRQVEGERESLRGWNDLLRKERDNAVVRALRRLDEKDLVAKDLTTLGQLVEALPVVDGRMDVECGACYYIRSFVAGQYGVVCGLITEQATAMAIKTLLEYRATLAQDAGKEPSHD